jgi:hypothetical protein
LELPSYKLLNRETAKMARNKGLYQPAAGWGQNSEVPEIENGKPLRFENSCVTGRDFFPTKKLSAAS